ncbi:MAG: hypothetical protein J5738_07945 [Lachnospiraceae bacterium]|nr:hypothetical protein [Lachnospiraceae bacterium]
MYDCYELEEIEEKVRFKFENNLEEILTRLNRTEELETFLKMMGLQELVEHDKRVYACGGKILVIGQSEIGADKLKGIASGVFGIDKDRVECLLEYEDAKGFDFSKIKYNEKYSCILVGPMPHSGKVKSKYSGIITSLENDEGYPPVVRMGAQSLKITKTSFREALAYAVGNRFVA